MRRTEHAHHTADQVAEYLTTALGIVNACELDGELRGIAFAKAVDLLAAKQIFFEEAPLLGAGGLRVH